MTPGLSDFTIEKAEGDPWAPADANAFPRASEEFQATFEVGHDADGEHRPPVPVAWAKFTCSGTTYTYVDGVNVDPVVVRLGVGLLQITLVPEMRDDSSWIAVANPHYSEPVGGREVAPDTGFKTTKVTRVQLEKQSGGTISAIDCSFSLRVYGETLL